MTSFIISGTDTGIGKTLLSSLFMASLPEYHYWKPVQSGTEDGTDSETVCRQSECTRDRVIKEAYIFSAPLSPHAAAKIDGMKIEASHLRLPDARPLIVEGAGGLLVPLTDRLLFIDVFRSWELPLVLACRSALGTINHTLLSLEALRARKIPIAGCVVIGEENPGNEEAIEEYGGVPILGTIPHLDVIDAPTLREVFKNKFKTFRAIL